MLLSDFRCKENDGMAGAVLLYQILPKTGRQSGETIWKIQMTFSDSVMGITQIKEWYNWFSNGRSGWPSRSQNDQVTVKVKAVVMQECHVTI